MMQSVVQYAGQLRSSISRKRLSVNERLFSVSGTRAMYKDVQSDGTNAARAAEV